MYISQNMADFLNNPMGKGSSVILNRQQVRDYLDLKYQALLDKFGDFKVKIYTHKDTFLYHVIIPSESQRRNNYDVVVQFVKPETDNRGQNINVENDRNISRYHIKLFSNSPSFTYTYAYVYNDYGCMVDQLQSKYPDDVLMNAPTTRNPGEIASYEKSTYYACKYLSTHRLMLDKKFIEHHTVGNLRDLIKVVRNTDTITLEIEKEKRRLEREGGNAGYKKLRKKTIKGSVYDTKMIKTPAVDKNTGAKQALKNQRKIEAKRSSPATNHTTNVIKPKPKIKARKSTVQKKKK